MANIKSAIKRNKQNEKHRISNRIYRGRARTFVQRARVLILAEEKEQAEQTVNQAIRALDVAAAKGVLHKNNAARRKSRLMKHLATLTK